MAEYFEVKNRTWKEIYSGMFVSNLHRYPIGGGAALFRLNAGTNLPVHDHPTGEHGYLIAGTGIFGDQTLSTGDAFWLHDRLSRKIHCNALIQPLHILSISIMIMFNFLRTN